MAPASMRQQFEDFLDDLMAGRYDEAGARLTPDVVWHLPPFAGVPPLEGHDPVMKFMRETPAALYEPGSMRIEKHAVTFDEPFASCLATLRAVTRHGRPYENRYVFFARMRDGMLAEVWELLDSVEFQAQIRPPE